MNKKSLIIVALVILVSIGLGFLFLGSDTNVSELKQEAEQSRRQELSDELVYPADFSLINLDGELVTLSDYRGEKPVILDFWASWCHNCQRDLPVLNELSQKYPGVEVIAINLNERESVVSGYVERSGFTFNTVLDPGGEVARDYGVTYTNTHVLIAEDGQVVDAFSADIEERHFQELL